MKSQNKTRCCFRYAEATTFRELTESKVSLAGESDQAPAGKYDIKGELSSTMKEDEESTLQMTVKSYQSS